MERKRTSLLIFGLLIYLVGMVTSLALNVFVLWANLEGQSFWGYPEALGFDSSLTREYRLTGLRCPLVLAPGEVGDVTVNIRNPNDYPITAWISAHISKTGEVENMLRETRGIPLEPGESSAVQWTVTEENILNQRMILVRVFQRLTENHPPARTKHCGIIAMDLWGLSGRSITLIALIGSHLFQGAGIWMWWAGSRHLRNKPQPFRNLMIVLSLISLVLSLASLLHSWIFGVISVLLMLLILFTTVGYRLGISERP